MLIGRILFSHQNCWWQVVTWMPDAGTTKLDWQWLTDTE